MGLSDRYKKKPPPVLEPEAQVSPLEPEKKVTRQGNLLVVRDARGKVQSSTLVKAGDSRPQTWRRALHKLTNGGEDMQVVLYNLMQGHAYTPKVVDEHGKEIPGRKCEPIIPTPEVRRAAAMDLQEMLHGKAVAETEVIASEREAEKKLQLESMSDAQLQAYIDGEYEVLTSGTETPEEGTERDATQEGLDAG